MWPFLRNFAIICPQCSDSRDKRIIRADSLYSIGPSIVRSYGNIVDLPNAARRVIRAARVLIRAGRPKRDVKEEVTNKTNELTQDLVENQMNLERGSPSSLQRDHLRK